MYLIIMKSKKQEAGELLNSILNKRLSAEFCALKDRTGISQTIFGERVFPDLASSQNKISDLKNERLRLTIEDYYVLATELGLSPDRVFSVAVDELSRTVKKTSSNPGLATDGQK